MRFIVIEIQTYADKTVGFLTYDFTEKAQAESKYHAVLSAAAVSEIPMHAAILVDNKGWLLQQQCYVHADPEDDEENAIAE